MAQEIPIIFHKIRNDAARYYEEAFMRNLLERLIKKLHTNSPVRHIEIGVNCQKNRDGGIKNYAVMLAIELDSGPRFVAHGKSQIAKAKGVGLQSAIREAFSDIEAQYRKIKR